MNFERLSEVFRKYSPGEERQFMEQARTELNAFSPLYEAYCQRIYAYCLRRTGQPEEAEDLTSLVFTRALTGLNGYRGGSVAAWLFQIAHNAVANHLRDRPARLSFEPPESWPNRAKDLSKFSCAKNSKPACATSWKDSARSSVNCWP